MSSIKTTQIDGDVSVGRNIALGGKLDVAGNATIGHGLTVKGWLEAANIKGVNKGIFLTLEDLQSAYPRPTDGWLAGVGASTPFATYIGKDGEWVSTGGTIDINIDMTQYSEDVAQLQQDVIAATTGVSQNATDITNLRTDLRTAVEKEQADIAAEASARTAADAAEAAARSEADAALQTLAEGVVGRIDVTAIDTVPGSVEDALAMAKDMLHSRWTLTYRSVLNVGVLDIFSDNAGHQLTEVLTTHYTMNSDGVLDFASHDDGAVTRYWRSYNISSPHLKNDKGTWSDWAEDIPASLQTRLDEIECDVVAAQSAADKAQASADKAQSDVAALAATKGEACGIAALDDDLKVPLENMPDSAFEVLEFAGTVSGVTALDQSVAQPAGVVFDTAAKSFYAYAVSGGGVIGTRTYYKTWGEWLRYKTSADGAPYAGKIYIDTTTNTPYRWNGTAMTALTPKQVTLTQEEYDAMVEAGTVDADTYYNVIEED